MGRRKKPKKPLVVIVALKLQTVWQLTEQARMQPFKYQLTSRGSKEDVVRKFMQPDIPNDLASRAVGNLDDIFDVQQNASNSVQITFQVLSDLQEHLAKSGVVLPKRLEVSSNLTMVGAAMVTSAYALHLRPSTWSQGPALIILRSAIEAIGKGAWVALGEDDEPMQMERGDEVSAKACIKRLDTHLGLSDEACKVYEWLCNFTHLDYRTIIKPPPSAIDVYAVAAYVAWLAAKTTEILIGQADPIAKPPHLPATVPWT